MAGIRNWSSPRVVGAATAESSLRDMLEMALPEWYGDALCAQTDPEAYFPEKGGSTQAAKKQCLTECTAVEDCLLLALRNEERFGVWGGFSERERRRMVHMSRAEVLNLLQTQQDIARSGGRIAS